MIYLHVVSGEADLYAKRADNEVYPDLDTFDFRSNTFKNDELMLPALTNSTERYETYIIGVYARDTASYQIIASKNSSYSFYRLVPGMILTKTFTKTGQMLVSFYNRKGGRFVAGAMSPGKPISIYYKSYSESSGSEFFDNIPEDKDQHFETKYPRYFTREEI